MEVSVKDRNMAVNTWEKKQLTPQMLFFVSDHGASKAHRVVIGAFKLTTSKGIQLQRSQKSSETNPIAIACKIKD